MLKQYGLFLDSFQFACKNFKGNAGQTDIAKTIGFESNEEYNEIMFLREITHTINAFNEMADVVKALFQENQKAAEQKACKSFYQKSYTKIPNRYSKTTGVMIYLHARSHFISSDCLISKETYDYGKRICKKKGKKWYYRFYVEDASGNLVQKECVGTESKSETEKLLRQAMDDYEKKKFVAKAENLTVGQLLDVWAEEELKTGTLSNGTVENYLGTIRNIKKHPLAERKLKNVTSEHLQSFFDLLSFGGVHPDGKERKGYSKDYIHSFSAVMQQSFRFAVFPKQYITFNPMQYIKLRYQTDEVDLFSDEDMDGNVQPISREDYERLLAYLQKKEPSRNTSNPDSLLCRASYWRSLRFGMAGRKSGRTMPYHKTQHPI